MKKFLLLTAAALAATTAAARQDQIQDPVRDDGMFNTFVIKGAELTPDIINRNKVILPSNLAYTTTPDSEFTFYYPGKENVFASCTNACLPSMFPDVKVFEIDGTRVSREEFYMAPAQLFNLVEGRGDTLRVETRKNVNDPSVAYQAVEEASREWFIENFGKVQMPESIVINDPSTLPANAFLNLNWVMTTPQDVAKLPEGSVKGYALSMFSIYPELNLLTKAYELDYLGFGSEKAEIPVSEVTSLSVGDIAAAANTTPAAILMIKFNGTTLTVYYMNQAGTSAAVGSEGEPPVSAAVM